MPRIEGLNVRNHHFLLAVQNQLLEGHQLDETQQDAISSALDIVFGSQEPPHMDFIKHLAEAIESHGGQDKDKLDICIRDITAVCLAWDNYISLEENETLETIQEVYGPCPRGQHKFGEEDPTTIVLQKKKLRIIEERRKIDRQQFQIERLTTISVAIPIRQRLHMVILRIQESKSQTTMKTDSIGEWRPPHRGLMETTTRTRHRSLHILGRNRDLNK